MAKWHKTQTDEDQASALATGIVTSNIFKKHNKRTPKRVWMITGAVALLVGGAVGLYVWHKHTAPITTSSNKSLTSIRALDPLTQVNVDATKAVNTSGAAEGDKVYEQAIATAKTDADKFTLYMGKGALDYNAKEYDAAIAAGLAAEKITASYRAWGLLARVYDAKGDTKNAIIYYQKAANDNVEFNYDQPFFQQRYKELTNGS